MAHAGEVQRAAGIEAGHNAKHHARQILAAYAQPLQLVLEAAGRNQPHQRSGQAASGQRGHGQQPFTHGVRAIQGGCGDDYLHKQNRTQHHAGIAGVKHQRSA